MRFQVPQFVDIEDKIIGPLTLKQFGYYGIAGMLIIILYQVFDLGLLITVSIPLLGTAAVFAHFRFHGQPFITVSVNAVTHFLSKRMFLWKRERGGVIYITGPEYNDYLEMGSIERSSLGLLAQSLTTEGNVVNQDVEDPILQADEDGVPLSDAPIPIAPTEPSPAAPPKDTSDNSSAAPEAPKPPGV